MRVVRVWSNTTGVHLQVTSLASTAARLTEGQPRPALAEIPPTHINEEVDRIGDDDGSGASAVAHKEVEVGCSDMDTPCDLGDDSGPVLAYAGLGSKQAPCNKDGTVAGFDEDMADLDEVMANLDEARAYAEEVAGAERDDNGAEEGADAPRDDVERSWDERMTHRSDEETEALIP